MASQGRIRDVGQSLDDRQFHAELVRVTPHLRAFARALCGCRDRADDLAQETLLKAWSARQSYQAGTNFKAWTFTILRNQFFSEGRRARFTGAYDPEMAERVLCCTGNQEESVELADLVRALATLPDTHRDALVLATIGDMAYEDIAAICGIALGTVKSRICRARAMLASAIDGGVLPDSRHDFVLEGDATDLLFAMVRQASNVERERQVAA